MINSGLKQSVLEKATNKQTSDLIEKLEKIEDKI